MPQLAPVIESLETVAEPLREFYVVKEGGGFRLDLSGTPTGFVPSAELATANGKVVEFRDNNTKLVKERDDLLPLKDLQTKWEGIDPEAARTAIAAQAALVTKGITKPGDLDTTVKAAVDAALSRIQTEQIDPLKTQLTEVTTREAGAQERADKLLLKDQVGTKFLSAEVGGEPGALDFILSKTDGVFKVDNGQLVALANQFSAVKPTEALGVDEWMGQQIKLYPFAFKASQGGGAPPANKNGLRPGQQILRDPTPEQLGDPAIAKQIQEGKLKLEYTS